MKKNIDYLLNKKNSKIPISMMTAYDFPVAQMEDEAGIDVVLIGDSVGTNVLGYKSEQDVTMADMLHHCGAVARGVKDAFIMVDMPFGSADDPFTAYENAQRLLDKGADCVKIEGWGEKKNVVESLISKDIPVCAHIGYNPQIHGPKAAIFGKTAQTALELIEGAKTLQDAGAAMIVVEKVPEEVAAVITNYLNIPVIGIGSGRRCDGQVLVVNDILGIGTRVFRHARRYIDLRSLSIHAISDYRRDVEEGKFPSEENVQHLAIDEFEKIKKQISG